MSDAGSVLHNSTNDVNYKAAIPRLTDNELRYCLQQERRKTGRVQLEREAKRRGIELKPNVIMAPILSIPQYKDRPRSEAIDHA